MRRLQLRKLTQVLSATIDWKDWELRVPGFFCYEWGPARKSYVTKRELRS